MFGRNNHDDLDEELNEFEGVLPQKSIYHLKYRKRKSIKRQFLHSNNNDRNAIKKTGKKPIKEWTLNRTEE